MTDDCKSIGKCLARLEGSGNVSPLYRGWPGPPQMHTQMGKWVTGQKFNLSLVEQTDTRGVSSITAVALPGGRKSAFFFFF